MGWGEDPTGSWSHFFLAWGWGVVSKSAHLCISFPSIKWVCTPLWRCSEIKQVQQRGDLQLMVMPSSTPRLLGSFTWKVPLLGMTDSVNQQPWVTQDSRRAQRSASSTRCGFSWVGREAVSESNDPNHPTPLLPPHEGGRLRTRKLSTAECCLRKRDRVEARAGDCWPVPGL